MSKRLVPAALLLAAGAGATVLPASSGSQERPDCPGTIICPLTGELVCRDRCPLGSGAKAVVGEACALPACCRSRN